MSVLSKNVNLNRLSLSWDIDDSIFMLCPDPCIISISGALTATQIFGPAPLPWKIPWKCMGE